MRAASLKPPSSWYLGGLAGPPKAALRVGQFKILTWGYSVAGIDGANATGPLNAPPGDSSHRRSGPGLKGARGVLSAVSWPWVPACGSLEPPRRDGQNAQKAGKTGENGGKMGEMRSKK